MTASIWKILKGLGILVSAVFVLVLLLGAIIYLPPLQNFLKSAVEDFARKQYGMNMTLEGIHVKFPGDITIDEIYLPDQNQDTLFYCEELAFDVDLLPLFKRKLVLSDIKLNGLRADIHNQTPDKQFNYQFILDNATPTDTLSQTAKPPWEISLKQVLLKNSDVAYYDRELNNTYLLKSDLLVLPFNEFNSHHNTYILDRARIQNSSITINQDQVPVSQNSTDTLIWGFKSIELSEVKVNFNRPKQQLAAYLGQVEFMAEAINSKEQTIELQLAKVHNTSIEYSVDSAAFQQEASIDTTRSVWEVNIKKLLFADNQISFSNGQALKPGFDPNDWEITQLKADLTNLVFKENELSVLANQVSFSEDEFTLKGLSGYLEVDDTKLVFQEVMALTGHTELQLDGEITYNQLSELLTSPETSAQVNLGIGVKSFEDLFYFNPELRQQWSFSLPGESTQIQAALSGSPQKLVIDNLQLSAGSQTRITAKGIIRGLATSPKNAYLVLENLNLSTTGSDVYSIVPDSMMPSGLVLPLELNAAVKGEGSSRKFQGQLRLQDSFGQINSELSWSSDSLMENPSYKAKVNLNNYHWGRLIAADTLFGPVQSTISLSGRGLDLKEGRHQITASFDSIKVNRYSFKDLKIEGEAKDGILNLYSDLQDENLVFNLQTTADLNPEIPLYAIDLDLEGASLEQLSFSKEPIALMGKLTADVQGNDPDGIAGTLHVYNTSIIKADNRYPIDSLVLEVNNSPELTDLRLWAEFLKAQLRGNVAMSNIYPTLKAHFKRYYQIDSVTSPPPDATLNLEVDILETEIITEVLFPNLDELAPGTISGSFSQSQQQALLDVHLPLLVYQGITIDSVQLHVESDHESMHYDLNIPRTAFSQYEVEHTHVSGEVLRDSLSLNLVISDEEQNPWYHIGAIFERQQGENTLHFIPGEILIDYNRWDVDTGNAITLSTIPQFREVNFRRNQRTLSIVNRTINADSVTTIEFKEFQLGSLVHMVEEEDTLLRGVMNGRMNIHYHQGGNLFSSDLEIDQLIIKNSPLGHLTVDANTMNGELYNIEVRLTENGNDLEISGAYRKDNKYWDLQLDMRSLNLVSAEPFFLGAITEMSGTVNGDLRFRGTFLDPDFRGNLNFTDAGMKPAVLGSNLYLNQQKIGFRSQEILFDDFTVRDSVSNSAVINGKVILPELTHMIYDLDISADNFRVLNSTASDNELYYGTLVVDANLDITGDIINPQIEAYIKLKEGSEFTYTIPEANAEIVSREGVVQFIDVDQPSEVDAMITAVADRTDTEAAPSYQGIDINANIEVDDNTQGIIVVDQQAGDNLRATGNGTLNFQMDRDGTMRLNGRYEITDGSYQLSFYDFVRRSFQIQPGSNILWSGDVLNPDLDITAIYAVETDANDLLASSELEDSRSGRTLPFEVVLYMEDKLLRPEINFEITLADEHRVAHADVSARLEQLKRDQSELNKQVFSLIMFRRFLAENTAQNGFVDPGNTARNSVSKLLTQQLNRIAENIQGVDLSFDLQSYNQGASGPGRTDLELAMSKRLFNDRLIIRVGGDINLEGNRQTGQTGLGGDVLIEYELTEDGRYRLKGFRRSDYDVLLEGDIVETGIGILFVKDYNEFSELFKKSPGKSKNE